MTARERASAAHRAEPLLLPFFASFRGQLLIPPSVGTRQRLSMEELRDRYPKRFAIWNKIKHPFQETPVSEREDFNQLGNWLRLANNLDRYVVEHHAAETPTLKPRQINVVEDILKSVERGEKEGYVEAPTGFGKTVVFGKLVAAADTPTVIVVPTKRLVEQTYASLKAFNPDLEVGRVYAGVKEYGRKVTVTTYHSLTQDKEGERFSPAAVGVVILDEVDEVTGPERIKAMERFPDAHVWGFSATPVKLKGERYKDTRVAKMMNNEIHKISLVEAVDEGYIASFSSYLVAVDVDISTVTITASGDYDEKELERYLNTQTQNEAAVNFFTQQKAIDLEQQREKLKAKYGRRWKAHQDEIIPLTTSVYATSVAHAQALARAFRAQGINAAAVWGEQDQYQQDSIMSRWGSPDLEVVVSKDLLVRGNDIPGIRLVLNVAPTASPRVEKQRSGRGLRIDPNNPDKHTIIADFTYKNDNRRAKQVTFADVAGVSAMFRTPTGTQATNSTGATNAEPHFQISGLTVITSPEEVMRVVRGMGENTGILPLQPTDVNLSPNYLRQFDGRDTKVRKTAEEVFAELALTYPDLVLARRSGNITVTAFTDADLFVQMMAAKGILRKGEKKQVDEDSEVAITGQAIDRVFRGGQKVALPIAEIVAAELAISHPQAVRIGRSGNFTVPIVNRELLVREMRKRGVEPKDKTILPVQPTDILITQKGLPPHFVGDWPRVRDAAKSAMEEISRDHPEAITQRLNKKQIVTVVTDHALLERLMLERGVYARR